MIRRSRKPEHAAARRPPVEYGSADQAGCALIGMKHCGKTTVGRRLAELNGLGFQDLDLLLQECYAHAHQLHQAPSVREIYRNLGRTTFQEYEQRAVTRLEQLLDSAGKPLVVACGGGLGENPNAMARLVSRCVVVYLDEDPDVLYTRVAAGGIPPFLDANNPRAAFKSLWRKRDPLYRRYADRVVTLRGRGPDDIVGEVQAVMQEFLDVR